MFIFYINGHGTCNEYDVTIYKNNLILFNGKTKNNKIEFNFKKNNLYIIKLINPNHGIYKYISYYCKKDNESNYYNIRIHYIIRLKLIDNYYGNLPIEKGNIILWQDM